MAYTVVVWGPLLTAVIYCSIENLQQVHYQEPECWCTIYYYELNQRVGPPFKPTTFQVVINGYTGTFQEDHFCLSSLSNPSRNEMIEAVLKHIGPGIKLTYFHGDLYLDNLGDHPVFLQNNTINQEVGLQTVTRISNRCSAKAFSNVQFGKLLQQAVQEGYEKTYSMSRAATVLVSFIKGWGPEYHRQNVNSSPCWLEVQMHGPLTWMDKVLKQTEPLSSITSKS